MTNERVGGKPTPDELRKILTQPARGRVRLHPIPEDFEVHTTAPEDEGALFQDDLDVVRERATENNPLTRKADALPAITTNIGRVNFIYTELSRENDSRLAKFLGTTPKAAQRWREKGSHSGKKGLVAGMIDVYTLGTNLKEHFLGNPFINDRIQGVLHTADYDTGFTPWQLIRLGKRDKALALVQKLLRREKREP